MVRNEAFYALYVLLYLYKMSPIYFSNESNEVYYVTLLCEFVYFTVFDY